MEIMKELETDEEDLINQTQTGSKMLSNHRHQTGQKCLQGYFLFPTIERMKETPAGRRIWIQVISQTKRKWRGNKNA